MPVLCAKYEEMHKLVRENSALMRHRGKEQVHRAGSSQVSRLDLGCDDPAGNQRKNMGFGMEGLSPPFSISH